MRQLGPGTTAIPQHLITPQSEVIRAIMLGGSPCLPRGH